MTLKYDLWLESGSVLTGLLVDEVADQIRAGKASLTSDCCESGKKTIRSVRLTVPGIDAQVQRGNSAPKRCSAGAIMMTTEPAPGGLRVVERREIITAECAFGMNIFKDLFIGVRDFFGGRSKATQKTLRDSRKTVLSELANEASEVGANAVIGVSISYSEFSGQGKSMMFVVASGTAVVVEPENRAKEKVKS